METIEALKRKVQTAEDLHSVVKTMKAMAAANIRQLELAVDSLTEYKRTIELGLRAVLRHRGSESFTARAAPQKSLGLIVLGSDQGMCGQLNDQIAAKAMEFRNESSPHDALAVLAVGMRVASRIEAAGVKPEMTVQMASSTAGVTPHVQEILLLLDRWQAEQRIDRVVVFFCEHISRAAFRTRLLELLPIDRKWLEKLQREKRPTHVLPQFTMDTNQLLSALVRQYLFVSLFRACAESLASENASRLAAMRGAERNIGERIGELTSVYHQTRQMAITEELLDIVSGFEALDPSTA